MDKLTVRDMDASGKRVFVRVDFNVPLADGRVTDDSRIRASLPTIRYLQAQGARVILASHLGRPAGKVTDSLRLRPVAERLGQLIGRTVPVTGDALGVGTEDAVRRMRNGEILLLENLRFHVEEEANDPAFAETLASYCDIYVNDAFGTAHRAHASTVGIAKLRPAYAGLLMEKELANLGKLLENPEHPFAAVIGGAKVSDKIKVLEHLLDKVDVMVIGGGMANTFLLAQGKPIGKSLAEPDRVEDARSILAAAERGGRQGRAAGRRRGGQGGHPRDRVQDDPRREGARPAGTSSTSASRAWPTSRRPSRTSGPCSGTGRWACSRSPRSRTAPRPSPGSSRIAPRPGPRSSSGAATRWPRSSSRGWPTR